MAVPSPDALEALEKLSDDPKNVVYIISGRDSAFLDQHLGHLTNMGFSAEHGCFVKEPSVDGKPSSWTNLTESLDMSWMSEVKEIFEYYTERTTGSFIELKKSSITWHYRASDPEWGRVVYRMRTPFVTGADTLCSLFQCRQCLDLLETNVAPKRPIEGKLSVRSW
jgi:trehalose 6-phosphate synthase/phosphatase